MKKTVFGLLIAGAVLALALWVRNGKETAPQPMQRTPEKVWDARSPEAVLAIRPDAPAALPVPAASNASRVSPLMREVNGPGPFKPVYERLKAAASRTPEENYLLAEMLRMCRERPAPAGAPKPTAPPNVEELRAQAKARLLASISDKDPTREKRLKTWAQTTQNKCEGLEGLQATDAEMRALLDQAAAGGDPKARARVVERDIWTPLYGADGMMQRGPDYKMPTISDAQLDTLREVVRSNDPSALMIAGRVLASTMDNLTIRAGPFEQPIDAQAFNNAWMLAACDAGFDCGPTNSQVLWACYGQGNCDATNLRDVMFFYNNSPQQSQRLAEYQVQIARAVQTGDWSYFQFVRQKPPGNAIYGFGSP